MATAPPFLIDRGTKDVHVVPVIRPLMRKTTKLLSVASRSIRQAMVALTARDSKPARHSQTIEKEGAKQEAL